MSKLERVEHIEVFLHDFHRLQEKKAAGRKQRMAEFLDRFAGASECEVASDGNLPSFFWFFRREDDELTHSRLISWMLDARGSHGMGPAFLQALGQCCELELAVDQLKRYSVRTEHSWLESVIDVFVYRPGDFAVYLENKVHAVEGYDQTGREYRDLHSLSKSMGIPEHRRRAVFLTPEGRRPESGEEEHWRTLSYGDLSRAFGRIVPSVEPPGARLLLEQWLAIARELGGST